MTKFKITIRTPGAFARVLKEIATLDTDTKPIRCMTPAARFT